MNPIDYDKPQFLEPAHAHNPLRVSHIATPPATLAESAPQSFRDALIILQESTSVAFASSKRLQALVGERFHRLIPVRAQLNSAPTEIGDIECAATTKSLSATQNMLKNISDSEPAFFTYTSQLQSEKRYLLEEALPDWRHKAARVLQEHSACDTKVLSRGKVETGMDFETWWTKLQEEVDKWLEEAENRVTPDFEDTVAEYRIFQA